MPDVAFLALRQVPPRAPVYVRLRPVSVSVLRDESTQPSLADFLPIIN